MTYLILRYVHLLGLTLMGAGLIGVWYADLRSRQVRDLPVFGEAVRQIAVFYDGLVVPGALLLLGSRTWLTITVYGALSANMRETVTPWKFSVEGEQGLEAHALDGELVVGIRGGGCGKGDAATVHGGVQAKDRPGGRRL
jgi:hypothetical protein